MAVNLSLFAGAGWQFFDNSGNVLTGGKIYTYAAGTTTPETTYTSNSGLTPNANPIILDASGRLSGSSEIWLTATINYKFVLTDSNDVLIGTYDNIAGAVTDANALFFTPDANSLLAPGPVTVKQAIDDITDTNTGSSVVGFKQTGVNTTSRTVLAKLQEYISVKDFGAVGDGVTDDTTAIQTAINSFATGMSGGILFPAGAYLVTATLTADRRYIEVCGDGVSASQITYQPASAGVLFDLYNTVADNKAFSFKDITITTPVVNAGTAIKIQVNLTSAPVQVNGQRDSLYLNNVRILQSNTGYWTVGLHSLNNGGVHFQGLTIDNNVTAAQADVNTIGVFIELNDTKAKMIRSFMGSDLYILRAYNSIKVTTPSVSNLVESIYVTTAELVGIGNAAFKIAAGGVSAFSWDTIHVDTTSKVIDTEGAYFAVARFVNCDFRRSTNGGAILSGPFNIIDCGESVQFSNSAFRGSNNLTSNVNNYAFKFTNTGPLAAYSQRCTFANNVFVNFYNAYSDSVGLTKSVCTGNSYNFIESAVYIDTPLDIGITKNDAVISKTIIVTLTASGTFTVTVPTGVNYFNTAYPVAFLQQAATSGTDILNVYYDFGASTSSQCVFRGSGNATFSASVRFSFMAMPTISQPTTA